MLNTLIEKWVESKDLENAFIKLTSSQSAALAIAPALGTSIMLSTSTQILYFIDSLSFILALFLIIDKFNTPLSPIFISDLYQVKLKDVLQTSLKIPLSVPKKLWLVLISWFGFLTLGALINALEFPKFQSLAMSKVQIGNILTFWGAGSFVPFVLTIHLNSILSGIIFMSSIFIFLYTNNIEIAFICFIIGGWSSTLFSGSLRAQIHKNVPAGLNTLPIWTFANQITQLINLIAYVGVGLLFSYLGLNHFTLLTITVGVTTLFFILQSNWYNHSIN